jgi:hypothetical protein
MTDHHNLFHFQVDLDIGGQLTTTRLTTLRETVFQTNPHVRQIWESGYGKMVLIIYATQRDISIWCFTFCSSIFQPLNTETSPLWWRAAKFRPMLGAHGLWAWRETSPCHTCCDTRLWFFWSHQKDRPFRRLLRHARGCWRVTPNGILTGPHSVASYDTQLDAGLFFFYPDPHGFY